MAALVQRLQPPLQVGPGHVSVELLQLSAVAPLAFVTPLSTSDHVQDIAEECVPGSGGGRAAKGRTRERRERAPVRAPIKGHTSWSRCRVSAVTHKTRSKRAHAGEEGEGVGEVADVAVQQRHQLHVAPRSAGAQLRTQPAGGARGEHAGGALHDAAQAAARRVREAPAGGRKAVEGRGGLVQVAQPLENLHQGAHVLSPAVEGRGGLEQVAQPLENLHPGAR